MPSDGSDVCSGWSVLVVGSMLNAIMLLETKLAQGREKLPTNTYGDDSPEAAERKKNGTMRTIWFLDLRSTLGASDRWGR